MIDPLSTLKQIREVIKKCEDRDLVRLLLALQGEVFELHSANLKLDAELTNLKRLLDLHKEMHMRPPFNYYFQKDDDRPFCPRCWESDGKAIHLPAPEQSSAGTRRVCRICEEIYWERAHDQKRKQVASSAY